jgi:hypothetical protein
MLDIENFLTAKVNQDLVKIIKNVVDKNNPKKELNYLYYDGLNKKLVSYDTLSILICDMSSVTELKDNKFIDINLSAKKIICENDDGFKYPEYARINPTNYKDRYDNVYSMIKDETLNFPIYNKRIQTILTTVRECKNIKKVSYGLTSAVYKIEFYYFDIKCEWVLMSNTFNIKYDVK